jgi:hypothetical protein
MKELYDKKLIIRRHVKNSSNEYKLTVFGEFIADILKKRFCDEI